MTSSDRDGGGDSPKQPPRAPADAGASPQQPGTRSPRTLVTHPPEIREGHLTIPKRPGLGTAINEEVARAHAWEPGKAGGLHRNIAPAKSF